MVLSPEILLEVVMKNRFFVFVFCFITVFSSCTKTAEVSKTTEKKLVVTVSIAPQAYIVRKIAGDNVDVNVMVPSNVSPETYEPGPKKMVELKESAIYFSIGLPFEKGWLEKVKNQFPGIVVAEMHKNVPLRSMGEDPHHECKGNHHHHHHHHGSHDPHVWTDPVILIVLAQNTLTELLKADNSNRDLYIRNHIELKKELQTLHDETAELLKDSKGAAFVVYHPAWGYFADRYGLKQMAIEVDGKEPSASDMAQMVKFIKDKKVEKIFVQKQFSDSVVKSLSEETGIESVIIDPLEEDVVQSIRKSAKIIKEGLVK